MNYIKIDPCDGGNGPGIRTTLWVAGCEHRCLECQNPETWNPTVGKPFNEDAMHLIESQLKQPRCAGLTLSGGDPLHPNNRDTIYKIVRRVKEKYPNKSIWMWTGYAWEQIQSFTSINIILINIDILVDGPFIQSQRDITLEWRGSSNQRIIDVQKSLQQNRISLWKDGQYK